jgi:hypothetical protein
MKILLALTLMILAAPAAGQVDLNAPVRDNPTVGSEMERGVEAAQRCIDLPNSADEIDACASAAKSANEQRHANHSAFDVGLLFETWWGENSRFRVDEMLRGSNRQAAREMEGSESEARKMFELFRQHERALKITDEQMLDMAHIDGELRARVVEQMRLWDEKLNAS